MEWDSENLIIHLNREEVSLSFDNEGKCVEMATRASSTENSIYWQKEIDKEERYVGETKYYLTNNNAILNFLSPTYAQLIKVDENGHETILYSDGGAVKRTFTFVIICIAAFLVLFYGLLLRAAIEEYQKYNKRFKNQRKNGY